MSGALWRSDSNVRSFTFGRNSKQMKGKKDSTAITLATPSASLSKAKMTNKIKEQTERKIFMTSNSFPTWFKGVQVQGTQLRQLLFLGMD